MNNPTLVHWNEEESKLYVNINIEKPLQLKADMYDCSGNCIMHVFDKFCKSGELNAEKKLKDIPKGLYIMKFSSDEGQNIIRFKVH